MSTIEYFSFRAVFELPYFKGKSKTNLERLSKPAEEIETRHELPDDAKNTETVRKEHRRTKSRVVYKAVELKSKEDSIVYSANNTNLVDVRNNPDDEKVVIKVSEELTNDNDLMTARTIAIESTQRLASQMGSRTVKITNAVDADEAMKAFDLLKQVGLKPRITDQLWNKIKYNFVENGARKRILDNYCMYNIPIPTQVMPKPFFLW